MGILHAHASSEVETVAERKITHQVGGMHVLAAFVKVSRGSADTRWLIYRKTLLEPFGTEDIVERYALLGKRGENIDKEGFEVLLEKIGPAKGTHVTSLDTLLVACHLERMLHIDPCGLLAFVQVGIHQMNTVKIKLTDAATVGCKANDIRRIGISVHPPIYQCRVGVSAIRLVVRGIPGKDELILPELVLAVHLCLEHPRAQRVAVELSGPPCGVIGVDKAVGGGVGEAVIEEIAPRNFVVARLPAHVEYGTSGSDEVVGSVGAKERVGTDHTCLLDVVDGLFVAVGQGEHSAELVAVVQGDGNACRERVGLQRQSLVLEKLDAVFLSGVFAVHVSCLGRMVLGGPLAILDIAEEIVGGVVDARLHGFTSGNGIDTRADAHVEKLLGGHGQGAHLHQSARELSGQVGGEGFGDGHLVHQSGGDDIEREVALVGLSAGQGCPVELHVVVTFAHAAHHHILALVDGDTRDAAQDLRHVVVGGLTNEVGTDAIAHGHAVLLLGEHGIGSGIAVGRCNGDTLQLVGGLLQDEVERCGLAAAHLNIGDAHLLIRDARGLYGERAAGQTGDGVVPFDIGDASLAAHAHHHDGGADDGESLLVEHRSRNGATPCSSRSLSLSGWCELWLVGIFIDYVRLGSCTFPVAVRCGGECIGEIVLYTNFLRGLHGDGSHVGRVVVDVYTVLLVYSLESAAEFFLRIVGCRH